MDVSFETNSYLSAVKGKAHLNDDGKIEQHAKSSLQYKYVDVSAQEFSQHYSSEGWFGRKVIALPAAIWSGIVKTIYHLAKAIFIGMIVHLGDSNYLKAQFFYIAKDLQESFGWLATLFNDRYGQYHIQESGFHKSCYDCFLSNHVLQPDSPQQAQTSTAYQQVYDSPTIPSHSPTVPLTTPLSPFFQYHTPYGQDGFPPTPKSPYQHSNATFTNNVNRPSDKQSVISRMMGDPSGFAGLKRDLKNDEDVVVAALSGCQDAKQARIVINSAGYNAKDSTKVAIALVKIDPTLLGQLNYKAKNDEDVVLAALSGCQDAKQAHNVISNARYKAKESTKVALALVKIDPTLLGQLNYKARNTPKVVLLAIELSSEQTIDQIWSSVGIDAAFDTEVRDKLDEKYPNFFQKHTFKKPFPNFFHYSTYNSHRASKQTAQDTDPIDWTEPDDLIGNTSDEANIVRRILAQNHRIGIDLTRTDISKDIAKDILSQLLELDKGTSDQELKKVYRKTVLIVHPDKMDLRSGEEAFKMLNAAYRQAGI